MNFFWNRILAKKNILIIEDEETIADLLIYSIRKENFMARAASNGAKGLELIESFKPNLIILDLMLPDISGFEICKQVSKKYGIPIIMLTAKSDITDKLIGLELGADDYITKPFDIREVVIRIKILLRRLEQVEKRISISITVSENIHLYEEEHKVLKDQEPIELTPKEYDLLCLLVHNKGRVFSREELLDKVWGFEYFGDCRTVDVHVQRLRKKLASGSATSIIETVFGVGYKLIK